MIKKIMPILLLLFCVFTVVAQQPADTMVMVGKNFINLSEVVVNNKLNVARFISQIKNDSSFYKAFRNLHLLSFTSINDIRMLNKDGSSSATLFGKTKQLREGNCRRMETIEEQVTGDFYNENQQPNYYTAQMYASLFFTKELKCGETNIVAGREFNTEGKSGVEKHKEQLKMLFFNPGKRIRGLPFMSSKTAIYDDDMASLYDMAIGYEEKNKINCYVFRQKVKPGNEGDVLVDEMNTWFDATTMDVVARNYHTSYDAGVYDFKVQMEVEMTHAGKLVVPSVMRYNGNWKIIFKKRERGVFTATLYDFK